MSTRRRREMRFSPAVGAGSIPKANIADPTHKKSSILGADYGEINKTNPHNLVSVTGSSFSVAQARGNQGVDFEEQLNEIDTELGIYEEPKKLGSAKGATPLTAISQPFNMDTLKNELTPTQQPTELPLGEAPSHRPHARPFLDVTNQGHAPSIVEPSSQTKWKRIIHEFSGKTSTLEDQIGLKRPSDMVIDIYGCDRKCKWIGSSVWRGGR
nr:hypothetical protein CFP56_40193 [Quercus suber]